MVERLQRENESLRKPGGKQTRAQGTTQVGLEAENKRLKVCIYAPQPDSSVLAVDVFKCHAAMGVYLRIFYFNGLLSTQRLQQVSVCMNTS